MATYEGRVVLSVQFPHPLGHTTYGGDAELVSGTRDRNEAWWRGTIRCPRDRMVEDYVGPAGLAIVGDDTPRDVHDHLLLTYFPVRIVDPPVVDAEAVTVKVYGDGAAPFDDEH